MVGDGENWNFKMKSFVIREVWSKLYGREVKRSLPAREVRVVCGVWF